MHSYTLGDRDRLFNATLRQVEALVNRLGNGQKDDGIDNNLLEELIYAGLNATGFSEQQRAELIYAGREVGRKMKVSVFGRWWPFEALNRKDNVPDDVVDVSLFYSLRSDGSKQAGTAKACLTLTADISHQLVLRPLLA